MSLVISARGLCYAAAAGSAALLLGAFIFQALGYAPCPMCIWQRYPHVVAIAAGALVLLGLPFALSALVGMMSAATTSAIGIFHTGVERGWWEGPSSCTGSGLDLSNMSASDLLPGASSGPTNLVMCDQVVWEFMTLSMASWNAISSAGFALFWAYALIVHSKNEFELA